MKNASNIMYKIGKIFNIVLIVLYAVLIFVGLILAIVGAAGVATETEGAAETVGSGISMIVWDTFYLAASIVCLILTKKAMAALNDNSSSIKPHIIMIVAGAICNNVFLVLGGIFGIIAEKQTK